VVLETIDAGETTAMKVFFDEECLLHDPPHEILSGKLEPYFEAPKRLLQIRQALEENALFRIGNADRSIDAKTHALQVHSEDYVEYLETAFRLWVEEGGDPKV
jgi:acetoin utilization deacetylase AcuC-like enzyme